MSQSFKYLFLALFLVACQSQAPEDTTHSAYYWTTTFQLSQQKSDFIRDHHIRHLYVRFFDVVSDEQGGALPNATITFADTVPSDLEVIPTVFIMNDCLTHPADSLAQHISSRILKMCRTHDIPNVREIQIDCDWTARTQQAYFQLLADMRQLLKPDSIELSSTTTATASTPSSHLKISSPTCAISRVTHSLSPRPIPSSPGTASSVPTDSSASSISKENTPSSRATPSSPLVPPPPTSSKSNNSSTSASTIPSTKSSSSTSLNPTSQPILPPTSPQSTNNPPARIITPFKKANYRFCRFVDISLYRIRRLKVSENSR